MEQTALHSGEQRTEIFEIMSRKTEKWLSLADGELKEQDADN